MAYADTSELAAALRVRVTEANEAGLQACLDAAAAEIDHAVDWAPEAQALIAGGELPYPDGDARLALLDRVNLLRGVEWWKANDAAFGVLGYDENLGTLRAPRDGFERHALTLGPLKQRWGIA